MTFIKQHSASERWNVLRWILAALVIAVPSLAMASEAAPGERMDLTMSAVGIVSILIFTIAYGLVMAEEYIHLHKSKPVLLAAGLIWFLIAWVYGQADQGGQVEAAIRHNLLEYSELLLFLLVAMTYVNAMEERRLFDALRGWLVNRGFGFRTLFWLTGILAFFISPIADNLTTALVMCAVVMAVGGSNTRFVNLGCINIVVAANAGGAFSPFGDITTLMVWQKGIVSFSEFFALFIPSVVNYVVPAVVMFFFIPNEVPVSTDDEVELKRGARRIIFLFLLTIATAVMGHSYFHIPPAVGMMMGLAYLNLFGFFLVKTLPSSLAKKRQRYADDPVRLQRLEMIGPFNVFNRIARAEWDTLLFFYGVVMCVGGLGFIGYLSLMSEAMYGSWDPIYANVAVGVLSAIVDNIPVMFAVLTMQPDMSLGNWLLVTLTAGVGGSMLSIGSAAGVALMGQARGKYTFIGHLKWAPVIALGYIASIWVHLVLNADTFEMAVK